MSDAMGTTDVYAWSAVMLSLLCVGLGLIVLVRAAHGYQYHHDDRAAVNLAKALGLTVVSVGLTLSAAGLVVGEPILSTAGLSIARGALVVVMATLVLADVRPPP